MATGPAAHAAQAAAAEPASAPRLPTSLHDWGGLGKDSTVIAGHWGVAAAKPQGWLRTIVN
jgi:hypothetical protein